MEASSSNRLFTKEWHGYLFLILLTMPVFFFHLGRRDFWAPDEPRFAQMAREMMERGDWIVPYLNNEPYGEKPPLTFWLMSLFCYLGAGGQVTPFWARLLSGIAGFLGVLFVFWYVKRALASQWLALLSAMILASNFRYFWQSQYLMIDMSFAFLAFSAVFLLKEGIEKNRPSLSLASYILLGFACLSKGPLAFVIAFLAFVPYYGYMYFKKKEFLFTFYNPKEEDFPSSSAPLIKEKPFFTWRIHIIGFFLLFSIAFSWYAAILYQEGWDFFYFNIIVQNYKRFTGELGSHLRPWFYYFLHFPPDFMPWTLLLPGAFYIIWKEKKKNPLILWLIFWAASFWFFLNLSKAKFSKYLLPVYPCFAIIVGYGIVKIKESGLSESETFWFFRFPFYLTAFILGLAGLVAPLICWKWFPAFFWPALMVSPFLLLATIFISFWNKKGEFSKAALSLGVFLLYATFAFGWQGWGELNKYKSAKKFGEILRKTVGKKNPWCMLGTYRSAFVFYSGLKCTRLDEDAWDIRMKKTTLPKKIDEYFKKHPKGYIVSNYHPSSFPSKLHNHTKVVYKQKIGHRYWYLYSYNLKKGS